jgi:hypothetical protein
MLTHLAPNQRCRCGSNPDLDTGSDEKTTSAGASRGKKRLADGHCIMVRYDAQLPRRLRPLSNNRGLR